MSEQTQTAFEQLTTRIVASLTGQSPDVIKTAMAGSGEVVGLAAGINPALLGPLIEAIMAILMDMIENCPQRAYLVEAADASRFAKVWLLVRFVRPNWEGNELASPKDVRDEIILEGLQASKSERSQIIADVVTPDFSVF
jgi:hypothetical protein